MVKYNKTTSQHGDSQIKGKTIGGNTGGNTTMKVTVTPTKGFNKNTGEITDGAADVYGVHEKYIKLNVGNQYEIKGESKHFTWLTILGYDSNKVYKGLVDGGGENSNPSVFMATPDCEYIRVGAMHSPNIIITDLSGGIITDGSNPGGSNPGDTSGFATKAELNAKQDKLVSGTNIKTINGISLLGSGNIPITSSGGTVPVNTNGMVSVLTFGADNTGTQDCTSAIQSALDYSSQTGKSIYFPPGKYRLDGTLYLNGFASLVGDNKVIYGINEFDAGGNKNDVIILTKANKIFQGHNKSETQLETVRLGLEGLSFQHIGDMDNSTFLYKIHLHGSYIHNCLIRQYATVILGCLSYVTIIDRNVFFECRKNFLKSKNISGLSDARPAALTDAYITNNYINGSQYRNSMVGFDIHYPNYSVIHNNFIDFFKQGINISGGQGLQITNNNIQYCMEGIHLETAGFISISNNSFGLMNSASYRGPWTGHNVDLSSWDNTWVGIQLNYQCGEISITNNLGMSVDKLVRINGAGYRNLFINNNVCYNPSNIVNVVNMGNDPGFPNSGQNINIQGITTT